MLKYSAKSLLRFLFAAVSCSLACAAQSGYWYPCPYDKSVVCADDKYYPNSYYSLCREVNWGKTCGSVNGQGVLWVSGNCGTAGSWVEPVHFNQFSKDWNLIRPAASDDQDQRCTWK